MTDPRVAKAMELHQTAVAAYRGRIPETARLWEAHLGNHLASAFAKCDADYAAMRELVVNGGTEIARLIAELEEARKDAGREIDRLNNEITQTSVQAQNYFLQLEAEQKRSAALAADARRYRWWRTDREVTLIVAIFGNGCINKTIEMVEEHVDAAMTKEKP